MDEAPAEQTLDKVQTYRRATLLELFPGMTVDEAEELALGNDRLLLEKANRLAGGGCPATFAYRILRPIPGEAEPWAK